MDSREQEIIDLRAAVRVGEESLDARRRVRLAAIADRLNDAPGLHWYSFDRQHQQAGQIHIYSATGNTGPGDHVANVLARAPKAEEAASLISHAPDDIRWLLEEVARLRRKLGDRLYEPE